MKGYFLTTADDEKKTMTMTTTTIPDIFDITPRDALTISRAGNLHLLDIIAKRLAYVPENMGMARWRWSMTTLSAFWRSFVSLTDDECRLPEYMVRMCVGFCTDDYMYTRGYLFSRIKRATRAPDEWNEIHPMMLTLDAIKHRLRGNAIDRYYFSDTDLTQDIIDVIAVSIRKAHQHRNVNMAPLVAMTISECSDNMDDILAGIPNDDIWGLIRPRITSPSDRITSPSDRITRSALGVTGYVYLTPHLISLVTTKNLRRLLRLCLSSSEAFFVVYEALHRGIDVREALDEVKHHNRPMTPTYHVAMAYNHIGSLFGREDRLTFSAHEIPAHEIDWKVDAICHSREVMEGYITRPFVTPRDIWAITRAHPDISPPPSQQASSSPSASSMPLQMLVDAAVHRVIPDEDIKAIIDGRGIINLTNKFMTAEVFRSYMRLLSPMYHARIIGEIRMVKIFIDAWGRGCNKNDLGYVDVTIIVHV